MKAIVCDRCGKVSLLEEPYSTTPFGYRLIGERENEAIDLCEDCGNELLEAVRNVKVGGGNA